MKLEIQIVTSTGRPDSLPNACIETCDFREDKAMQAYLVDKLQVQNTHRRGSVVIQL